jgi:hypothetical protein
VPLATGFETRSAVAAATISDRLGDVEDVPCPVVKSYHEISFTGTDVDAVLHWRSENSSLLDQATHFAVGVWEQPPSAGVAQARFLVSVMKIGYNLAGCPPHDLPDHYLKKK